MGNKFFPALCTASFFCLLLSSCASTYQSIKPDDLYYDTTSANKNVRIDYATDVLTGKYAVNERKTNIHVVAVKITNNSGSDLVLKNNLKVFMGNHEILTEELSSVYNITQQNPDKYLKYLFLMPLNVYAFEETTNSGRVTSRKNRFYPIGAVLGPALAFSNKGIAKKANKKYKADLDQYNLLEKIIPAGKSEFGLIGLRENPAGPLTFKISNGANEAINLY